MELCLFLLFVFVSSSSSAVVKWLPNKSFYLPINFKDGKLPCSKQTVVFPHSTLEATRLDHDVAVSGLILPNDGEIAIGGVLTFGVDSNVSCAVEGNAYYLPRSKYAWNQAGVWASSRFNEATPDAERVPCFNDKVEFPSNAQFTVVLPYETQYISSLKIGDEECEDDSFFGFRLQDTYPANFVENRFGNPAVRIKADECQSMSGCRCQENTLATDCSTKLCPKIKCIDPVRPIGHCCKICGGFITMGVDDNFDYNEFEENVAKIIESYGKEDLIYHVGRIPSDVFPNKNNLQVVVVESGEYTGKSAYVVHMISVETGSNEARSLATVSGSPISKQGLAWKIFFSMFFAVALAMGAIYFYYYKLPEMPQSRFTLNRGRRGMVSQLTRFNRRTDSVVTLARRDSGATIASVSPTLGITGTAFRNPLYDSRRGRVVVTGPVKEEDNDSLSDKVY